MTTLDNAQHRISSTIQVLGRGVDVDIEVKEEAKHYAKKLLSPYTSSVPLDTVPTRQLLPIVQSHWIKSTTWLHRVACLEEELATRIGVVYPKTGMLQLRLSRADLDEALVCSGFDTEGIEPFKLLLMHENRMYALVKYLLPFFTTGSYCFSSEEECINAEDKATGFLVSNYSQLVPWSRVLVWAHDGWDIVVGDTHKDLCTLVYKAYMCCVASGNAGPKTLALKRAYIDVCTHKKTV